MRLIDADALEYHEIDEIGGEYNPYLGCSKAYIDRQPTIEPCQVGKWIELPKAFDTNENPCKCSACGHILSFMHGYPKSNFCPQCGAKMEHNET